MHWRTLSSFLWVKLCEAQVLRSLRGTGSMTLPESTVSDASSLFCQHFLCQTHKLHRNMSTSTHQSMLSAGTCDSRLTCLKGRKAWVKSSGCSLVAQCWFSRGPCLVSTPEKLSTQQVFTGPVSSSLQTRPQACGHRLRRCLGSAKWG